MFQRVNQCFPASIWTVTASSHWITEFACREAQVHNYVNRDSLSTSQKSLGRINHGLPGKGEVPSEPALHCDGIPTVALLSCIVRRRGEDRGGGGSDSLALHAMSVCFIGSENFERAVHSRVDICLEINRRSNVVLVKSARFFCTTASNGGLALKDSSKTPGRLILSTMLHEMAPQ